MSKPFINPFIALAVGVCSISTSAVIVKLISAPAPITATYRLLFTVILMTPLIVSRYRSEFIMLSKKDLLFSSTAGIFLALHFILWFESLNYTSVASSVVLVTLQPVFAFLGTYFFYKEKLSLQAFLSSLLAITGSMIISWGDFRISGLALLGDFLALLGAVMITIYFLVGQNVRKRLSLGTYTYLVYSFASLSLLLYSVLFQYPLVNYPVDDWFYFLYLALVPTLLGHTLFNWALKWLSTSTISMSILFEPIGASILAYFILGETLRWPQWVGGTVVILGILMFLYTRKNDE